MFQLKCSIHILYLFSVIPKYRGHNQTIEEAVLHTKVTVQGYFGGFIPCRDFMQMLLLTNFRSIIGFYIQQLCAHQPGKERRS